jgi:hypothetical protein
MGRAGDAGAVRRSCFGDASFVEKAFFNATKE